MCSIVTHNLALGCVSERNRDELAFASWSTKQFSPIFLTGGHNSLALIASVLSIFAQPSSVQFCSFHSQPVTSQAIGKVVFEKTGHKYVLFNNFFEFWVT